MEYIGKRISIKRTDGQVSIVILSTSDKVKKRILFIWFILWSLCGIIVLTQYFLIQDPDTKVAVIVWLGFWGYFEYKSFRALMWRFYGMEKIRIKDRKLSYKKDVAGKGKVKVYELDFIKDFSVVEKKDDSFFENLNSSYWVIAGEKLTFDYYGKEIKLGIQLDEADAKALHKLIKNKI
ncbi:MAG: hypothetical protein H0X46_02060 [Bacteroidetes bacterium]|nr:hypothetical protein [Bacteroidota bacterium]